MTVDLSMTSFAAVAVLLAVAYWLNIHSRTAPVLHVVSYVVLWGCLLLLTFMTVALVVTP